MVKPPPQPIYRSDYNPPHYQIDSVELSFQLTEEATRVNSLLHLRRNHQAAVPLILQGEHLVLESLYLDGKALTESDYQLTDYELTITQVPDAFTLEINTLINPKTNTALEGLYLSNGIFCTQCEAHGFRRITYFLDRPDVMAKFTTRIEADKTRYPILLSNGNLVASGEAPGNRHWVSWSDPFKKPCYLFALVAGDLACVADSFVTRSNREVKLQIYVEHGNQDKCAHAMTSLKNAMRWDEEHYGREYDLDIFMLVAVSSFNMGAMENKGLNIFNDKYVLAKPETATDQDYQHIESVIAHEYFHNWTGNRITCRDWFQLSLKEGLTVFRDQEFSSDMGSRAVNRIEMVRQLRAVQFLEDASPLAHPVRPDAYIEMNNFYTATVYEKGAELIRMLHTLLGPTGFRRGMDLYFERHDGQAVTCDDFVQALADANQLDLEQFRLWYSQIGTPQIRVKHAYHAETKTLTLAVAQTHPMTPGEQPLHLPMTVALLDRSGQELPVQLLGENQTASSTQRVFSLQKAQETFTLVNIAEPVIPSVFREFSAPIKLQTHYSDAELIFLWRHDTDPFNRWEAGQQFATKIMLQLIADYQAQKPLNLNPELIEGMKAILLDANLDKALKAQLLELPSYNYLAEWQTQIDVDATIAVRNFVLRELAAQLQSIFQSIYTQNHGGFYQLTANAMGQRSLKNSCLHYLSRLASTDSISYCFQQFQHADNMTDVLSALKALSYIACPEREQALQAFYQRWQHEPLVIDKWFSLQASIEATDTLSQVKQLLLHPAFHLHNPNRVRALIAAFSSNFSGFHRIDGAGYQFLAEQILQLNSINPQIAARLLTPLTRWQRYQQPRQALMQAALVRISREPGLSKDVFEIVTKGLTIS